MKTAEQIIAAIEQYYVWSTERPRFYFRDVRAMEEELALLESLRDFIVDDAEGPWLASTGFIDFLTEQGYGAFGYSYGKYVDEDEPSAQRPPVSGASEEEIQKMDEFGMFWREYLASTHRK